MASKKQDSFLGGVIAWVCFCLFAFAMAWIAAQLDKPNDLDKVFNEGMATGADLCTGAKEAQ